MKTQDKTQIEKDLLEKGYTISAAARAIGKSKTHVFYVVRGKRVSCKTLNELQSLTVRPFRSREKINL